MKKSYLALAGVALMSAFTACSNDDDMPKVANVDGTELAVKSVGVADVNTKAGITATSFTNGEKLGLYIYRGDDVNAISAESGRAYNESNGSTLKPTENVPYYWSGTEWAASQKIILSNVIGTVYAYYPYNATNNDGNRLAIPVSVATNQGSGQTDGKKDYPVITDPADEYQYDYMWATPVNTVSNAAPSVELAMNHALAMITFQFKQTTNDAEAYPGVGKVEKIELKNKTDKSVIKTGAATMSIKDGSLNLDGTVTNNSITVTPDQNPLMGVTTENEGAHSDPAKPLLPRLLVYPSAVGAEEAEVTFTVDGNDYTLDIPTIEGGWQRGNNYLYTITLKGTGLSITSVGIAQWTPQTGNTTGDMVVQDPDRPVIP